MKNNNNGNGKFAKEGKDAREVREARESRKFITRESQVDEAWRQRDVQIKDEPIGPFPALEITELIGRYAGRCGVKVPVNAPNERVPLRKIEAYLRETLPGSPGYEISIGPRLFTSQMRANRSCTGNYIVFELLWNQVG